MKSRANTGAYMGGQLDGIGSYLNTSEQMETFIKVTERLVLTLEKIRQEVEDLQNKGISYTNTLSDTIKILQVVSENQRDMLQFFTTAENSGFLALMDKRFDALDRTSKERTEGIIATVSSIQETNCSYRADIIAAVNKSVETIKDNQKWTWAKISSLIVLVVGLMSLIFKFIS